jgi:thioredoxin 1
MLSPSRPRRRSVAKILDVTDGTFEEDVLKSEQPVLIDFWAEWCAPCRQLAPVVKQLADEYGDRLRVAKVDADANTEIAAKLQIRALPTLLLFKDGEVKASLIGNQPKAKIQEQIEAVL